MSDSIPAPPGASERPSARVIRLASCRPQHRGRDTCEHCGWVRDEGRPAARLPDLTWREQQEQARDAFRETLGRQRGVVAGILDVLAFYMALRSRDASAERALARVMDRLVAFEARCAAGDAAGGTVALRAWLAGLR